MPLRRLFRVKQRPVGPDFGLVRRGIWPWQRARMGDVHLGGSDEGDAHPELLRRLGPSACHRPDAALRPERDSGFGGDRREAGDLPRRPGNRLADRLELHDTVWRSAVRLAGVRCAEPRGGCESLRVDLVRRKRRARPPPFPPTPSTPQGPPVPPPSPPEGAPPLT